MPTRRNRLKSYFKMALEHGDAAPAVPGALVFVRGGGAAATGASRGQSEEPSHSHCATTVAGAALMVQRP